LNDLIRELDNEEKEEIEPNSEEIKIAESIFEYMLKLVNKNENEFNNSEGLECDVEYQTNFECSDNEYEQFLKQNEKVLSDKISFQYIKDACNLKLEKGYKYTTIKNRYKLITNERQFNRYVKYVEKGDNNKQKI
jgi:hypothetical protein